MGVAASKFVTVGAVFMDLKIFSLIWDISLILTLHLIESTTMGTTSSIIVNGLRPKNKQKIGDAHELFKTYLMN